MRLSLLNGVPDCSGGVLKDFMEKRVQAFHRASIKGVLLRAAVVWKQNDDEVANEQVVRHSIVPKCGSHSVCKPCICTLLVLRLGPAWWDYSQIICHPRRAALE